MEIETKRQKKKRDENNKLKLEKREKHIKIFTLYCQRKQMHLDWFPRT